MNSENNGFNIGWCKRKVLAENPEKDIPKTPDKLITYQRSDLGCIQRHFKAAGLTVSDPKGLLKTLLMLLAVFLTWGCETTGGYSGGTTTAYTYPSNQDVMDQLQHMETMNEIEASIQESNRSIQESQRQIDFYNSH